MRQLPRMKVLAAMSGGVDSAVAAARCVDAGHDVTGVHLALSPTPQATREGARGCCTLDDARDARRAADLLGIPFYVWDVAEQFKADVIEDFLDEYANGRTPNPCLRCNEKIKFEAVLDRAQALGFDAVATGHYAQVMELPDGTKTLHRGVDDSKDQSYVLAVLTQEQVRGSLFPLGDSTKEAVRVEAALRGLQVAQKPDSHDVCFIPSGDTAGWLAARIGEQPGPIVDETGEVVGAHSGAYAFTVGQRRGLHLGIPAADGKPRYVLGIEPVSRTVTVGPQELLAVSGMRCIKPRWVAGPFEGECLVQVRAHGAAVAATTRIEGDEIVVDVMGELSGVAAGQAAVFYRGDQVLGSATIAQTLPTLPTDHG